MPWKRISLCVQNQFILNSPARRTNTEMGSFRSKWHKTTMVSHTHTENVCSLVITSTGTYTDRSHRNSGAWNRTWIFADIGHSLPSISTIANNYVRPFLAYHEVVWRSSLEHFVKTLPRLLRRIYNASPIVQNLGDIVEAGRWLVMVEADRWLAIVEAGRWLVSHFISHEQVIGHCLLRGVSTCGQLKKKVPPRRITNQKVCFAHLKHWRVL